MPRTFLFLLPLALLTGCYDEDAFANEYSTAFCDRVVACETDIVTAYTDLGLDEETAQSTYDTTYTAACETETDDDGDDSDSDCDFDKDAAKECVEGIEALSCDFFSTGTGFPDSCSNTCG